MSVEGPGEFARELQIAAMRVCSTIDDPRIDHALSLMVSHSDEQLVYAALKSLAARIEKLPVGAETLAAVSQKLQHEPAEIRCLAEQVLLALGQTVGSIHCLQNDEDALCRALFVYHSSVDDAYAGLRDSAATVRMAAVERLMSNDEPVVMKQLVSACLVNAGTESLRRGLQLDTGAGPEITSFLSDPKTSQRSLDILLMASGPT